MNTKAKLILSAALLALLTVPASARNDSVQAGTNASPRFTQERASANDVRGIRTPAELTGRPFQHR
jgi:hypothetical protein